MDKPLWRLIRKKNAINEQRSYNMTNSTNVKRIIKYCEWFMSLNSIT